MGCEIFWHYFIVTILVNHNLSHLFALNFPLGFTKRENFGMPKGCRGELAKRIPPLAASVTQYGLPLAVRESAVGDKRAQPSYRTRLLKRGMARFEVLGLDADRNLIRSLAKRLAENDPEAAQIRVVVSQTITGEPPKKGGILAACAARRWWEPISISPVRLKPAARSTADACGMTADRRKRAIEMLTGEPVQQRRRCGHLTLFDRNFTDISKPRRRVTRFLPSPAG